MQPVKAVPFASNRTAAGLRLANVPAPAMAPLNSMLLKKAPSWRGLPCVTVNVRSSSMLRVQPFA